MSNTCTCCGYLEETEWMTIIKGLIATNEIYAIKLAARVNNRAIKAHGQTAVDSVICNTTVVDDDWLLD